MYTLVESNEITEIFDHPKALTVAGVKHPRNIFTVWSEAELKAIGVYTAVIDTTNLNSTAYYVNTGITYTYNSDTDTVTGTYGTATPQSLDDVLFTAEDEAAGMGTEGDVKTVGLKKEEIIRTNRSAGNLLDKYDWYTLRAARGGAAIPSAVATYQAAVTTKANEHEAAINAVSTLSAFAALEVEWPSEPS